jgi:hypothetical protein
VIGQPNGCRVNVGVKNRGQWFGNGGKMRVSKGKTQADPVFFADSDRVFFFFDLATKGIFNLIIIGWLPFGPDDSYVRIQSEKIFELLVIISKLL